MEIQSSHRAVGVHQFVVQSSIFVWISIEFHKRFFVHLLLQLKWPFTEWETGPEQKSRQNGKENGKWPHAWNGRKMAGQNQAKIPFSRAFFHFDCHFSAISGVGPFAIFFPIFPGFLLWARFPFCKWPLQSQTFCCAPPTLFFAHRLQTHKRTPQCCGQRLIDTRGFDSIFWFPDILVFGGSQKLVKLSCSFCEPVCSNAVPVKRDLTFESSMHSGRRNRKIPLLLKTDSQEGFVGHWHVAVPLISAPPTPGSPNFKQWIVQTLECCEAWETTKINQFCDEIGNSSCSCNYTPENDDTQHVFSSKPKGPGEKGAAVYCRKILLQKRPKWCSVLSIGVIGKSALKIGQVLRRNSGWFLGAPFSPGPFSLLLVFTRQNIFWKWVDPKSSRREFQLYTPNIFGIWRLKIWVRIVVGIQSSIIWVPHVEPIPKNPHQLVRTKGKSSRISEDKELVRIKAFKKAFCSLVGEKILTNWGGAP